MINSLTLWSRHGRATASLQGRIKHSEIVMSNKAIKPHNTAPIPQTIYVQRWTNIYWYTQQQLGDPYSAIVIPHRSTKHSRFIFDTTAVSQWYSRQQLFCSFCALEVSQLVNHKNGSRQLSGKITRQPSCSQSPVKVGLTLTSLQKLAMI